MAKPEFDEDDPRMMMTDTLMTSFNGIPADVVSDVLLTCLTKVLCIVYQSNFAASDAAIDSLCNQLKETVRMEYIHQTTEETRAN